MKTLITILLAAAVLIVPSLTHAHEIQAESVPTFSQCSELSIDTCPEYRAYLLELLLELIEAIKEARGETVVDEGEEMIDETIEEEDVESEEPFDRVVIDLSSEETRSFRDSTYRVLSDGTLSGQSRGNIPDVTLAIWNDFRLIATDEFIQDYVVSFRAYYDENDSTAAQVRTTEDDYREWELSVNVSSYQDDPSDTKEFFLQVLTHEFGHFVTLNDKQLDLTARTRRCGTYFSEGDEFGCFYANSYVNEYVKKFWGEEDFERAEDLMEIQSIRQRLRRADKLHESLEDEFYSPYAMTELEEDVAESFTFYIFTDEPRGDDDILEQKWFFFDEYSELKEIREGIREKFTTIFN